MLQTSAIRATLQFVVTVQFDIGIALAGHVYSCVGSIVKGGGTGIDSAAGVDLQVVEGDVHIALGGVDGDCVLIRRAGDDGFALIFYEVVIALLDFVRPLGLARFHGDVAVGDVPSLGKSRGGQGGEHGGGQDERRCPLRGRTG